MKRMKLVVGTQIWLVPLNLVSRPFLNAVSKLNLASDRSMIEWTDEEEKTFLEVDGHQYVHKPL